MKKITVIFMVMLLVLTGCSSRKDIGYASFKLPRQFKIVPVDNDYQILYTDESNGEYRVAIIIGTYLDDPSYDSFEEFMQYLVESGINEYADSLIENGSYAVPNQREISLDGKQGYKTMIISETDQFKIEMIHVPITYDDDTTGFFEVILEYNSPTYPDLAEDFMNSFKWTSDVAFE